MHIDMSRHVFAILLHFAHPTHDGSDCQTYLINTTLDYRKGYVFCEGGGLNLILILLEQSFVDP